MSSVERVSDRRRRLYKLLGELPPRDRPIEAKKVDEKHGPQYVLESWTLDLNGVEPVPAYLVLPPDRTAPYPAVLYNHPHDATGKRTLLDGPTYMFPTPYAQALAGRGYAVLAIDHWGFGERSGRTESEIFKEMLWFGQVLWGMMVYDSLRALDFLCDDPRVDRQRVATVGMSMGSTMAWWTAALDERIRVVVDLCCLTDFRALIEARGLDEHGIYYYVPNLLRHFQTADINALIAPRPHLSLNGVYDLLTPPAGLDTIDIALKNVYGEMGVPTHWHLSRYAVGHLETEAMRLEALAFLDSHLMAGQM